MSHTAGIIMGTEFPGDPRYEVRALRETEATAPPGRPLAPATWLEYAAGDGSVASTPFALKLLRAALHDQELPSVPPADPTRVENAAE